jgi:predicted RNA-binding Zn-ribbon protein involved in translation (DUF1610 family)
MLSAVTAGVSFVDRVLQFRCPHCAEVLRINPKYLGQVGKCKRCGGRIALIGSDNPDIVQAASLVDDGHGVRDTRPATPAQQEYLRSAGVAEEHVANAQRHDVSTLIQLVREDLRDHDPPTTAQMELLKRLVRTRSEASRLIEGLQPKPTEAQLQYLERLGATPEQLAAITTRSEAGELIEQLLRRP